MLSCRTGHSRPLHLLEDLGKCSFGRLFTGFLYTHSSHSVTSANPIQVNSDQLCHVMRRVSVTSFSFFGTFVDARLGQGGHFCCRCTLPPQTDETRPTHPYG